MAETQTKNLQLDLVDGDSPFDTDKVKSNFEKNELEIVISEGKNRQVRRMCEAVKLKVLNLQRTKIGNLELGNLELGKYRYLNKNDLEKIKSHI